MIPPSKSTKDLSEEFEVVKHAGNVANIYGIIRELKEINNDNRIVLSINPVPLKAYTGGSAKVQNSDRPRRTNSSHPVDPGYTFLLFHL